MSTGSILFRRLYILINIPGGYDEIKVVELQYLDRDITDFQTRAVYDMQIAIYQKPTYGIPCLIPRIGYEKNNIKTCAASVYSIIKIYIYMHI